MFSISVEGGGSFGRAVVCVEGGRGGWMEGGWMEGELFRQFWGEM